MMSLERKRLHLRRIGRSVGFFADCIRTHMADGIFRGADNKGVSGLYLLKEHSLYLPFNC